MSGFVWTIMLGRQTEKRCNLSLSLLLSSFFISFTLASLFVGFLEKAFTLSCNAEILMLMKDGESYCDAQKYCLHLVLIL